MSSTYMVFRCVFTIINMCFFVSTGDKHSIELRIFFSLGIGFCHSGVQLVVTCEISGLSTINGDSVVYSACGADYFRFDFEVVTE